MLKDLSSNAVQAALTHIRPVLPVAPYVGGKRNLARRLIERIGAVPHALYAEPFVGMGGVFLRRGAPAPAEVINDISADVVTLFRVAQRHPSALVHALEWLLASRETFDRLLRVDPGTLTDIDRAARFLYLQRCAFGGKVSGRCFGASRTNPSRFDTAKLMPMLKALHARLSAVTIERLPWDAFIARYDAPGTLFYLDPPYWGCEDDYGKAVFAREDFAWMADVLSAIKGGFLLSINDVPEIRALFAGFDIEEVAVTYRISGAATPARELIISPRTTPFAA